MCGYYFSNNTSLENTNNLKRRGPDEWNETSIPGLGHFGSARLTTLGQSTKQPVVKKFGVLLFNGAVYNDLTTNDTKWIADSLTDCMDDNIDLIRSLDGEYSLTWVTEKHVLFCSDVFRMRPLYYYYNDKNICVASLSDCIRQKYKKFYRCRANTIYIYDRTSKSIRTVNNKTFNLEQTVNHYDNVWEEWERAIKCRHSGQASILMSSGYDSGLIACTANKFYNDIDCYYTYNSHEDKEIINSRKNIHGITIINLNLDHGEDSLHQDLYNTTQDNNQLLENKFMNAGDREIYTKHMIPKNKRILIGGDGGDDIYSDYGLRGLRLRKYSRFGGYFPRDLSTVWPWHENNVFENFHGRTEIVGGYHGIEYRCPFMSNSLIQAWINTTHELKNKRHKGWMAQYMDDHSYPYANLDTLGPTKKSGAWHQLDG
tara:strand:- start:2801 stop:4084 length:1284 start_codon:yes stop_codon:yes gene_type:complete